MLVEQNDGFFGIVSETRSRWWQAYRAATDNTYLDPHESRFYMAARFGLTAWVEAILEDKRNPWEEAIALARASTLNNPL